VRAQIVASIDRTAYPRFKRSISVRELREAYSPSLDELEWARQMTDSDEALLSLTMCLKCCQRTRQRDRRVHLQPACRKRHRSKRPRSLTDPDAAAAISNQ
jgi:hypothetical protein